MYVAQVRTPSPAFVRSGLHHRRERLGHKSVARQAGADGSYFDNPDSNSQSGPKDGEFRGVSKDASAELDANNKEPEKIPDSQWYPGIVVYAITNVAFMKIFEYSMDVSDIRMTMGVLIAFYAVAYLLRFILRRVFKVDEKFPQFFWEGFPQRYKK